MRISTIVGARPQFVKAAVISRALRSGNHAGVEESLLHTGQHFDANMSDIFFEELQIPKPKANLEAHGLPNHHMALGRMIEGLEKCFKAERPDVVLIYGDTNSTFAGALAAASHQIPLAHVEAGLRSFNREMPEEQNRVASDHISQLLLAPTQTAMDNLAHEGLADRAALVGDLMYDNLLYQLEKAPKAADRAPRGDYILMTCHRAENTEDPARLQHLLDQIGACGMLTLFPIHPRTAEVIRREKLKVPDRIHVIEPLGYLELLAHLRDATVVATDSGGLQKEAYFMGKPCVILREETEWLELLETGSSVLVGDDFTKIPDQAERLSTVAVGDAQLYGDGNAGGKIVELLMRFA